MRSANEAVKHARRYTRYKTQYCLNFVQTMLGAPWSGPSAVWAWENAKGKHGPDPHPPAGVPVWILGSKYGHIALSVGGGRCRSTDYPGPGQVGEVGIQELARKWGRRYVGWAEYLGGEKIPGVGTTAPAHHRDSPAHHRQPKPAGRPPVMFVARYGRSVRRMVTGDRYVPITDDLAQALEQAGVPSVGITKTDHERLSKLLVTEDG